ncbi:FG-GAP-like repeat-containing protein [Verrucomicrobiaceae bacterium 227]
MTRRGVGSILVAGFNFLMVSGCDQTGPSTGGGASAEPTEPKTSGPSETLAVLSSLPDFSLTDQSGQAYGSKELLGRVWIADFIFTRCPSSCPMQTAEKAKLQAQFGDHEDLKLVTFSVDPEHDTPAVLAAYGARHGAEFEQWKFLTGKRGDLWNLSANGFKLEVAEDAMNSTMPILHSSDFALVDRKGRIRGIYDGLSGEGRGLLVADLQKLLGETVSGSNEQVVYEKVYHPAEIENPPWMKSRKLLQEAGSRRLEAFHDFKFEDVVESTGITFKNRIVDDAGKLYKAVHYDHGNGIAVADVDGDGLLDLYFSTQIGSNELWRNLGDGKFENITTPTIELSDKIGVSASFADTDNDGDPDLFVTSVKGGNQFFRNDGEGRFMDLTDEAGLGYVGHSSSGVFFDYDQDGLLDLFLCNVGKYTTDERGAGGYCVGFSDAFEGHKEGKGRAEQSVLYRNAGGNRFEDVSRKTGLVDESWSGDAAPFDYDGDGWMDLYVLSMQGNDEIYRNVAGERFEKVGRKVFPKTSWGAMGIQIFDFDNDGRQDVFVTDMHSDMSQGVGPNQEKEKADIQWGEEMLLTGGTSLFGNSFYRSLGEGRFEEISDKVGAENYWPWGLSAGDLNADGFTDVFITSSMNFPFRYGVNSLLLNVEGKRFADCEFVLGVEPRRGGRTAKPWFRLDPQGEDRGNRFVEELKLSGPTEIWGALGSRSSAILDLDNDGDLDIVTNEFHDGPMVLRSNLSSKRGGQLHWLGIQLVGSQSNRDGLGAVVKVRAGGKSYSQVNDGVTGYLSHGLIPLYFGLGNAGEVEKVEVTWPSGQTQVVEGLALGKSHTIREP